MSDGNWDRANRTAIVATAIALVAILLYGTWGLAVLDTKEAITASHRSGQYAKDTEQQILEACTVAELKVMRECVTEKVKASEENQRATDDLYAQNAVARWTFWLLILAIISTAITGVGLYYLARNLNLLREQNIINERALMKDRPWMIIDEVTIKRTRSDRHSIVVDSEIVVSNKGKTVALNVDINPILTVDMRSTMGFATHIKPTASEFRSRHAGRTVPVDESFRYPISLAIPKETIREAAAQMAATYDAMIPTAETYKIPSTIEPPLYVVVRIYYMFVGSERVHTTAQPYILIEDAEDSKQEPFAAVVPVFEGYSD